MKEREEASALDIIGLFFTALILVFILGCGLSIYESIKVNNEIKQRQQTEKAEFNNRKELIERLYKDVFSGER